MCAEHAHWLACREACPAFPGQGQATSSWPDAALGMFQGLWTSGPFSGRREPQGTSGLRCSVPGLPLGPSQTLTEGPPPMDRECPPVEHSALGIWPLPALEAAVRHVPAGVGMFAGRVETQSSKLSPARVGEVLGVAHPLLAGVPVPCL